MHIGTVAALYRYPVKAMAGESLTEAELGWFGLPGDRRYAFVQSDHTGDFPWLTIRELHPRRFRPSIVIDAPGEAFPEERLLGRAVSLGAARVRLSLRDERCAVVNFDPDSAERDPQVLRAVARHRQTCMGVYGSVEAPGAIRVGDAVQAA